MESLVLVFGLWFLFWSLLCFFLFSKCQSLCHITAHSYSFVLNVSVKEFIVTQSAADNNTTSL